MADDASSPAPAPFVGSGPHGLITESEASTLLDELARSGTALLNVSRVGSQVIGSATSLPRRQHRIDIPCPRRSTPTVRFDADRLG